MKKIKPLWIALLCVLVLGFAAAACAQVSNKVYGADDWIELDASSTARTVPLYYTTNLNETLKYEFVEGKYSGLSITDGELSIPANWSGECLLRVSDSASNMENILAVFPSAPDASYSVKDDDITVSWTKLAGVSGYRVEWGQKYITENHVELGSSKTSYTISDLADGEWMVDIYAYSDSDDGYRVTSSVVNLGTVQLGEGLNTILNADNRVLAHSTAASSITLDAYTENGAAITYALGETVEGVSLTNGVLTLDAGFYGNIPVKVTAAAKGDFVKTSKTFYIYVKPAAPTNVKAEYKSKNTAHVSWDDTYYSGHLFYYVSYGQKADLSDAQKVPVYDNEVNLEYLSSGCTYYICVSDQIQLSWKSSYVDVPAAVVSVDIPGKSKNTIQNFADTSLTTSTAKQYYTSNAYTADGATITYTSNDCPVESERNTTTVNGKYTIPANYTGSFSITAVSAETPTYAKTVKTITITVAAAKGQNIIENFTDTSLTTSTAKQYYTGKATTADGAVITYTSNDCPVESERGTTSLNGTYTIPANYTGSFSITATAAETTAYAKTEKTITVTVSTEKEKNTILNFEDDVYTVSGDKQYYFGEAYTADGATITYTSNDCPVESERGTSTSGTYTIPKNCSDSFTITAIAAETENYAKTEKTITVSTDGKVISFKVTKQGKTVNLKGKTVKLSKGDRLTVVAKGFNPSTAKDTRVKFKSSNTSIARITSKGVITARKVGTCTITVTASDGGGASVSFKIRVKK